MKRFVFKGSLGDVADQRIDFVKKRTEVHFSIFIENQNWDLKFVFRFDNENEKRKKSKLYFISKQKSNVPFDRRTTFSYTDDGN